MSIKSLLGCLFDISTLLISLIVVFAAFEVLGSAVIDSVEVVVPIILRNSLGWIEMDVSIAALLISLEFCSVPSRSWAQ